MGKEVTSFIGCKGYKAFAVHCQLAKVTKIILKQRNKPSFIGYKGY